MKKIIVCSIALAAVFAFTIANASVFSTRCTRSGICVFKCGTHAHPSNKGKRFKVIKRLEKNSQGTTVTNYYYNGQKWEDSYDLGQYLCK